MYNKNKIKLPWWFLEFDVFIVCNSARDHYHSDDNNSQYIPRKRKPAEHGNFLIHRRLGEALEETSFRSWYGGLL